MSENDIIHTKPFTRREVYKHVYISLDTAKLLKELDFNICVDLSVTEYTEGRSHDEDGMSGPFGWEKGEIEFGSHFRNNSDSDYSNDSYTTYDLPTQIILQGWLREVHGVRVWVSNLPTKFSSK